MANIAAPQPPAHLPRQTVVPLRTPGEQPDPARPTGQVVPQRAQPPRGRTVREPLWRHLVGEQLRETRHRRGDTLGQTARRAGLSPQYLSEIERGIKEPSSEMVAAVAGALGLTLLDLTETVTARLRNLSAARPTTRTARGAPPAPAPRQQARLCLAA